MQLPRQGFELGATSPFPMTLTITPRASQNVSMIICPQKNVTYEFVLASLVRLTWMEALGVMVKVMGNGLVAPSSNYGRGKCIFT